MRYQIEGLMLQALLCQAQADRTAALSVLQRALTLAEPEGYLRLFVDEGAPMVALLSDIEAQRIRQLQATRPGSTAGPFTPTLQPLR